MFVVIPSEEKRTYQQRPADRSLYGLTELGSDAVDRRLKIGDDGISRDGAFLSIRDGVGGHHQTKGQGGEEERGGASEQHCC